MERKPKESSRRLRVSVRSTCPKTRATLRARRVALRTLKKRKHLKTVKQKIKNAFHDWNNLAGNVAVGEVVTKKKYPDQIGISKDGRCGGKEILLKISHQEKESGIVCNNNENIISKLLESSVEAPVTPQYMFASNYQQLVQQAMDKSGNGERDEDVIPDTPQVSFKNIYQHLVTNALSLDKAVNTKAKRKHKTASMTCESIASMFKHGINTEPSTTPTEKSHLMQYRGMDMGPNRSVAEFSRCGPSGPSFNTLPPYDSDEDLVSSYNVLDQSEPTGLLRPDENEEVLDIFCEKEVSENITPPIAFHVLPKNKFIVVMTHPASLFFQGQLNIKVLAGSVKVLGYTLTDACSESSTIYSPAGFSKLSLQTVNICNMNIARTRKTHDTLLGLGLDSKLAREIVSSLFNKGCVMLLEQASRPLATYLASHCSMYLYPKTTAVDATRPFFEEEQKLRCQFEYEHENSSMCLKEPVEWYDLMSTIVQYSQTNGSTRVMICGGKSVGKSTLLRFLINQSLATTDEVLCLDFDPGQAEFTVPGSVSVLRINKPLLGPSFTHLVTPERMVYVGDVDITKCPDRYMKSAQHIIDYCLSQPKLSQMIWFINTMGFSQGLGVDLTTNLIRLVNPSHVVQIQSQSGKRNFPNLLSSENVTIQKSTWHQLLACEHIQLNYSLHVLKSAAEEKQLGPVTESGLSSKSVRNIMVLAYFHQMLKPPRFALTDIVPHKISFSKLKLGICHESVHYSQLLNVMNANLVALCVAPSDENVLVPDNSELPKVLVQPPVGPCLGFGVVRGVDVIQRLLYLITPLPKEQLKNINCLLVGTVTLPACMYMHSSSGLGHVPYVATGSGQATSNRITRRFIRPLKRKTGKD